MPLADVDLMIVNEESVEFSHQLHPGDLVSIYPVFESLDISPVVRVRKHALRQIRFMVGPGLERLGGLLRDRGFDVMDPDAAPLEQIIHKSESERRIFLTINAELLKYPVFSRIYHVREEAPERQLSEVLKRLDL